MARIRSIKPEFWSDSKIALVSHSCALFFIGLWNFCDDEGKFVFDPIQLSLRMPIFRSKDILTWLRTLSETGLIQVSEGSEWGLITNWNHQKINRPIPAKVKNESIQWLPIGHSLLKLDSSLLKHRKDRIGKDRIGKDRIVRRQGKDPLGLQQLKSEIHPVGSEKQTHTGPTWNSYCDAYFLKYNTFPVRNATVNSQMAQFVKRIGMDESPDVAKFFLSLTEPFYVKAMHSVGVMLKDAEKIRTQWKTGKSISDTSVKLEDQSNHFQQQRDRIMRGEL